MQLIDTHLHLDFDRYDGERDEVVARAGAAGVVGMITIGTSLETSRRAVELAERFPSVWAAVGIHPNDATEWGAGAEGALRGWLAHPRVVAIGEIGLDYYWQRVAHEVQQAAFDAQLALAAEVGYPVIIHNRNADADLMATLRGWAAALDDAHPRGVLHFFSGDAEMAREAVALGFYLGTDGPVTFKKATALQAIVRQIPLERLLVETDAPFLTPAPHRGKRNEPAYVRHVAEQVARLHGTTLEVIARTTTENARTLFRLDQNA